MKKWFTYIFSNNTGKTNAPSVSRVTEYKGLSDFLRNAPEKKKIEVFTEAARRANEDQRKTLERVCFTLSH